RDIPPFPPFFDTRSTQETRVHESSSIRQNGRLHDDTASIDEATVFENHARPRGTSSHGLASPSTHDRQHTERQPPAPLHFKLVLVDGADTGGFARPAQ